jgi:predicted ATPase/DNA-binding winged helix-turn-helix (wHTH) protein
MSDGSEPRGTKFGFGDHVVDLDARVVEHDGTPVPLQPQVFDVLALLIRNPDRVVSKLELLDTVWGDRFVSPATLTSRVRDLRSALGDSGSAQKVIRTAHGRGFRFVAPLVDLSSPSRGDATPSPARQCLTPLIGRASELEEVHARLSAGRLVTLVGPGGIGKTHLMRHVAADLDARVAELADVRDAASLPRSVLVAAGGTERPDVDPTDALVEFLCGREILLVLDNCEHVIDSTITLIAHLLGSCPGLRILATSRRPLLLSEESVVRIGVLDEFAASEMLIDRAARHGVELVDGDAEVARICTRLDRLPLAIELAASKTRALSLSNLFHLLDDRFSVLVSDAADPADHHRSLEAAIGWSVDLLTGSQRVLLTCLSTLVGPFDLAAATAVGPDRDGAGPVVADLMALTDLSLVAFDPPSGRYRLLESIWIHADSLGVDDETITRHRQHVLEVIESAGPIPATAFLSSLRIISDNWGNIRAVVDRAKAAGDRNTIHRVVAAVTCYAEQSFAFEVLDWIDAVLALDAADRLPTPPSTSICAALLLTHRSRFAEAAEHLDATRGTDSELLDLASMWHCYFSGDLAGAVDHAEAIRSRPEATDGYARAVAALAGHYLAKGARRSFDPRDIAVLAGLRNVDEATATGAKLCDALRLDWSDDADLAIEQLTEVVTTCRRLRLAFMASGASTALSIALAATPEAQSSLRGLRAALRGYAESGSWQSALADFGATALSLAHHGQAGAAAAAELLGARQAAGFVGDTSQRIAAKVADAAIETLGRRGFDDAVRQGEARDTPTATRLAIAALSTAIGD